MPEAGDHSDPLASAIHFNAHDDDTRLPCLCRDCISVAGNAADLDGSSFVRSHVIVDGRALHYWLPKELEDERDVVAERVRRRLAKHLANPPVAGPRPLRFTHWRLKQTW